MGFTSCVILKRRVTGWAGATLLAWLLVLPACQRPPDTNVSNAESDGNAGISRDLSRDEDAGGHTLKRHVGKSDEQLRDRLSREPDISAASSYTDRASAEHAVGMVLQEQHSRVESWLDRSGGHPNLVMDYRGDHAIGRTLHRGDVASQPCSNALVVLRWDGGRKYHVLTSYPECR